jgi:hypothetical protein
VLRHHSYLYGLAVDVANTQTVIVSASQWARQAHFLEAAESLIYRRESSSYAQDENIQNVTEEWKLVSNGLPKPTGTFISVLAANARVSGTFYAVNNRGIFYSTDTGISWNMLDDIEWPKEYLSQHPWALVVIEDT